MKVLVDTCVWSLALRRKNPDSAVQKKLEELVHDGRLLMIGPVRQEILSGISRKKQFETLKEYLDPFEDIPLVSDHFIKAAEFSNNCMKKGIQGSGTDFLISAVAAMSKAAIYSVDNDFIMYRKYLPIVLYEQ